MLVIFAGLPGRGKTTLARKLARHLGAVYLQIDSIERAITASEPKAHAVEDAGYMVGYALAEDNLRLDRTVIADSVDSIELTRDAWLAAASAPDPSAAGDRVRPGRDRALARSP